VSQQRVIDYHLARLKDRKADIRLDALHQLSLLKPPGWIETVRAVYGEDSDAGVREAARKQLVSFHVERLKSDQPDIRQESLRQYVTLNGSEAVRIAHTVYSNDSDKTVRQAARKLLVEYYIERLKSVDAAERGDAIDSLEHLNAEEALEVLQKVYDTDSDDGVRKLAQKAGRTIFMNTRARRTSGA
jgi:hypothetical protein